VVARFGVLVRRRLGCGVGFLEVDGGLHLRLTDGEGDDEHGEAGEYAGEQPPDEKCACGHGWIRFWDGAEGR